MEQLNFQILLNPSVPESDELRLSRQGYRIYKIFADAHRSNRLVANTELVQVGLGYGGRIFELRRALIPLGWCVDLIRKGGNGLNYYAMIRLAESEFYRSHKDKL